MDSTHRAESLFATQSTGIQSVSHHVWRNALCPTVPPLVVAAVSVGSCPCLSFCWSLFGSTVVEGGSSGVGRSPPRVSGVPLRPCSSQCTVGRAGLLPIPTRSAATAEQSRFGSGGTGGGTHSGHTHNTKHNQRSVSDGLVVIGACCWSSAPRRRRAAATLFPACRRRIGVGCSGLLSPAARSSSPSLSPVPTFAHPPPPALPPSFCSRPALSAPPLLSTPHASRVAEPPRGGDHTNAR